MGNAKANELDSAQGFASRLVGGSVSGISATFTADLHFEVPDDVGRVDYWILKCPQLHLTFGAQQVVVDAEQDPPSIAPLLDLIRTATVTQVIMSAPAELQVDFTSGHRIDVPSHPHFEGWELVGPDKMMLVAMPGGGFAQWS